MPVQPDVLPADMLASAHWAHMVCTVQGVDQGWLAVPTSRYHQCLSCSMHAPLHGDVQQRMRTISCACAADKRYHLYISWACPWASRCAAVLYLKVRMHLLPSWVL